MKKPILLMALMALSSATNAQSCEDIRGTWRTNVNAKIEITSIAPNTGMLSGTYYSMSPPHAPFPLTGFVTAVPEAKDGMHSAAALSFAVSFPADGEIISWTGICRMIDGDPVLETEDYIVSSTARNRWVHVASNHDTITVEK